MAVPLHCTDTLHHQAGVNIRTKQLALANGASAYEEQQARYADAETRVAHAHKKVEAVDRGMAHVDGENKSFGEEIRIAQEAATKAAADADKAAATLKHLKEDLRTKKPKGDVMRCDETRRTVT